MSVLKTAAVFALILLLCLPASAGASDDPKCEGNKCRRDVCFNLVCSYRSEGDHPMSCSAAAVFYKEVWGDGGEIRDRSKHPNDPEFEVECGGDLVFNNSAHRFTDGQGTRIQAAQGPWPSVILPKGALSDSHKYVLSILELKGRSLEGYCYLYTGAAL